METVARFEPRRSDQVDFADTPQPDPNLRLKVKAVYRLSEEGRKASLLAGGNGRELQEVTIHVPANRLHLVAVDIYGRAYLKLRPRFELNDEQRVVMINGMPAYDAPPSVDDLFREAGRNHQLEHAFHAERSAARRAQRDADGERREAIASAFMADATQRAGRRPTPNPQRCVVDTPDGRVTFDVRHDRGTARLVPPEAYRRWRADVRARDEWRERETAAQIATHTQKKHAVAEWVARHGTPEQQARQAAGLLPMEEVIEAMADQAFAAGDGFERYVCDGPSRVEELLRQVPQYTGVVVTPNHITIFNTDAVEATAAQWARMEELRRAFPDATVTLREHRVSWKGDAEAPTLTKHGVLVTCKVGPFDLRREYAAPDS